MQTVKIHIFVNNIYLFPMRFLSLRSFRLFQPLRFINAARKMKMKPLYKHPFNTPKYLKISLPLSLFALTYAFSTFSAKAYE